jgi:hypothetical protein
VPAGLFYLSLYDFNKDGHEALNRDRDYTISIRQHPAGAALSDIGGFAGEQDLAHGRIVDFWGGVWKRFLVRGPIDLTIELKRNNSLNTVLPTIMLDLVDEEPPPYFDGRSVAAATPGARLARCGPPFGEGPQRSQYGRFGVRSVRGGSSQPIIRAAGLNSRFRKSALVGSQ